MLGGDVGLREEKSVERLVAVESLASCQCALDHPAARLCARRLELDGVDSHACGRDLDRLAGGWQLPPVNLRLNHKPRNSINQQRGCQGVHVSGIWPLLVQAVHLEDGTSSKGIRTSVSVWNLPKIVPLDRIIGAKDIPHEFRNLRTGVRAVHSTAREDGGDKANSPSTSPAIKSPGGRWRNDTWEITNIFNLLAV
eukprot:2363860-Rhodomonas_salina.1